MKKHFLIKEKNATPGDGDLSLEDTLSDRRPVSVVTESSGQASTDPATLRTNTIKRFKGAQDEDEEPHGQLKDGKLTVQTGHNSMNQWNGKYFSQILPFVIPFMVSGPDFEFYEKTKRWRRRDMAGDQSTDFLKAPWVSAAERRCKWFL